jgi:hypothetical protein
MRKATHAELKKLRELTAHFIEAQRCFLCGELLVVPSKVRPIALGNSVGPQLVQELSIHHIDGDHSNNVLSNRIVMHRRCHIQLHNIERAKAKRSLERLNILPSHPYNNMWVRRRTVAPAGPVEELSE